MLENGLVVVSCPPILSLSASKKVLKLSGASEWAAGNQEGNHLLLMEVSVDIEALRPHQDTI